MSKQLTGPRADLAKAIDAASAGEAHVEGLRASVTRIEDQLYEARRQLEAAREADEVEKAERIRSLVAGGDVMEVTRPDPGHVREVERTIDACKSALAICKSELAEAETALGYAELRVRSAAGEVLAAEAVDGMLSSAARLSDELQAVHASLGYLSQIIPGEPGRQIYRALPRAGAPANHPPVARWREAYEGLLQDAGAALP